MTQELSVLDYTPIAVPDNWAVVSARFLNEVDESIAAEALLGKVEDAEANSRSHRARQRIKGLKSQLEHARKKLKEPVLGLCRIIDRNVATVMDRLDREDARLEALEKGFIQAELRRKREEEELQRRELERIERAKQAEILRIAREQAEAEHKLREAAEAAERRALEEREAAEKLAREAANKKQREAAEKARKEAEERAEAARLENERLVRDAAEKARLETQLATEKAEAATFIESKPVETSRARGQVVKPVWVIDQINDFQLMKARPDLVRKVEWDHVALKQALADAEGKLPGITAHQDITVGSRGGKRPFIEI